MAGNAGAVSAARRRHLNHNKTIFVEGAQVKKNSVMGGFNFCLTVILCIALACEVYFINDAYEWYGTNVKSKDSMLVKLVLQLRILADALTGFAYLVTWLNQAVVEAYMLSSPATFIAFSVVISIYFFCYPYIYQIASQDLSKEAECEAPAEYPPCQR